MTVKAWTQQLGKACAEPSLQVLETENNGKEIGSRRDPG